MTFPAARLTDLHSCPFTMGTPTPIVAPGCWTALIGNLPAARVTDVCACGGPPDPILMGSFTVFIGNLPAARIGDPTVKQGRIVTGHFPTLIG